MAEDRPKNPNDAQSSKTMQEENSSEHKGVRKAISDLRGWIAENRLRALLTGVCVALLMGSSLYVWSYLAEKVVDVEPIPSMENALLALDEGRDADAQKIIRALQAQDRLAPEDFGGPMYVLGVIKARKAQEEISEQRKHSLNIIASGYLEEAKKRGFPKGRKAKGNYLLAVSLAASGQKRKSVPVLQEALKSNPQHATELHRMLASAYLEKPDPSLPEALTHIRAVLADNLLSPEERAIATLQEGEILLRLHDLPAVKTILDKLPKSLKKQPHTMILQGQYLLYSAKAQASEADETEAIVQTPRKKLKQAIRLLREALQADANKSVASPQAMYLIAICYASQGEDSLPAALDQLKRTRKLYPESAEGLAASLAEADLLRRSKRNREALAAYLRTLSMVGPPELYLNRWVSQTELQSRLLSASQDFLEQKLFKESVQLVRAASNVFSIVEQKKLLAEVYRRWGSSLLENTQNKDQWNVAKSLHEGRLHLRHAGLLQEDVAKLNFTTRQYTSDVWKSAIDYSKGHSFTNAVRQFKQYLKYETISRRPRALVELGKAYIALGKLQPAIDSLQECIQLHPLDAAIFEARYECAKAYRAQNKLQKAQDLLLTNLQGDTLAPKSQEWRQSLFELGYILHENKQYTEAINKLTEAVERYPNDKQTVLARYIIADSYRLAAEEPMTKWQEANSESERRSSLLQVRELLSEAATQYRKVQEGLTVSSADGELTPLDLAVLRNSYLLRGSVLFDLKQYDDALDVYRNASGLYPNDPIVLVTYVQIANCHRRMNRPLEARGSLEQAKVVIKRIPDDADFLGTTNLSKDDWIKLLDSMSTW